MAPTEIHQNVTDLLQSICQEFDLQDMAYLIDFNDLRGAFPNLDFNQIFIKCTQMRTIYFLSSQSVRNYFRCWEQRWMKRDRNLVQLPKHNPYLWRFDQTDRQEPSPLCDLHRFGYRHKISLAVRCPRCEELTGRFTLFCNSQESLERVMKQDPNLVRALECLHNQVLCQYGASINPAVDYNLIKPTSIKVLGLLSQGYSRTEVAQHCCLSARGVDYHIDVLKDTMSARNMAHLISISKSKLLI